MDEMFEDYPGNDDYKIVEELGKGAFGKVYLVVYHPYYHYIKYDNYYAIKQISLNGFSGEKIQKIKNEATFLSNIKSDYIVRYRESFEHKDNNTFNIVMEYCHNSDLRKFINNHKKVGKLINENVIYSIILDLCLGINEIHKNNLIHRDLKPENIFIGKDFKIKIGDLGISKQLSEDTLFASTFTGTLYYMAPEIFKGDKYTNKVDIWSLGCIIYELFSLNYCFPQTNLVDLVGKITGGNYGKITYLNNIFSDWQNLIDMLLKVNPNERPDIFEVITYLKDHLEAKSTDDFISLNINLRKKKIVIKKNTIKIKIKNYNYNNAIYFISSDYLNQEEHSEFHVYINGEDFGTKNYFYFSDLKGNESTANIEIRFLETVKHCKSLFSDCYYINSLDLSNFDTMYATSMEKMFFNCKKLKKIILTDFDTECVINMNSMFENCEQFCKIDLSHCEMSSVIYMENMFSNCVNLKEISLPELTNAFSMYRMFYNCENLKEFDFPKPLEKCVYMTSMFEKCKCLTSCSLELYFDSNPKKLIDMRSMFAECENLEYVNFGDDQIYPRTIESMFYNCKKLGDVGDQMDLESCESMSKAFSNCETLKVVFLNKVKYGINYDDIFYNCHNLLCVFFPTEYLNLINIGKMFEYCSKLDVIYTSEKVNKDNIKKEFAKLNISPTIQTVSVSTLEKLDFYKLHSFKNNCLEYCRYKNKK